MDAPEIPWEQLAPLPGATPIMGGMGIVLRGSWRAPRSAARPVAVKVLQAGGLSGAPLEDALALVQREARAMRAAFDDGLNEFVVQLYGLARGPAPQQWLAALGAGAAARVVLGAGKGGSGGGGGEQLLALVMRWEEGGSLHELLHSPTRAWGAGTGERLLLCAQLASGLGALHGCSAGELVHGDIKAENVLLSYTAGAGSTPRPRISVSLRPPCAPASLRPSPSRTPPSPPRSTTFPFQDFGLATLRAAGRASRVSSVGSTLDKRGTWPYMAPEMLLENEHGEVFPASRSTDVYALGVLCWEVLTGRLPWEGMTEQRMVTALALAQARGEVALPRGVPLTTPPLPVDTPAAVKALLERCLGSRGARPRVDAVAEALHQAAQAMASGVFDVFLSHAWEPALDREPARHAPLTTEVYLRLTDAGLRVWLDTAEMGANPQESMRRGIEASGCVVALLSDRYGGRANCLRELEWARELGKPVVGCLAQAGGWFPARGGALADALDPDTHLFADLRAAAGVAWGAEAGVPAAEREALTKGAEALPKVLRLVREHVRARGVGGSGGSGGAGASGSGGRSSTGSGGAPACSELPLDAAADTPLPPPPLQPPAPPPPPKPPLRRFYGMVPIKQNGDRDFGPRIFGSLQVWRAAHPDAVVADVSGRVDLKDADFFNLRGIKALDMGGCAGVTDAAFSHLRGIHTLVMNGCNQAGITDAAFAHLRGIHTLDISECNQAGITDAAFENLRGIHQLSIVGCDQPSITSASMHHLKGIDYLALYGVRPIVEASARWHGLPVWERKCFWTCFILCCGCFDNCCYRCCELCP
jgi:serine/threonine protein kinase